MNDRHHKLERLRREMDVIALELLHVQFTLPGGATAHWRPAVNAFRCRDRFIVCVDLAGTAREAIKVVVEGRRLIVRGVRPSLEPGPDCPGLTALAMEIDHGVFERVLELPAEVDADRIEAEYRQGILWLKLPLLSSA